jgi:hypothetical protein
MIGFAILSKCDYCHINPQELLSDLPNERSSDDWICRACYEKEKNKMVKE